MVILLKLEVGFKTQFYVSFYLNPVKRFCLMIERRLNDGSHRKIQWLSQFYFSFSLFLFSDIMWEYNVHVIMIAIKIFTSHHIASHHFSSLHLTSAHLTAITQCLFGPVDSFNFQHNCLFITVQSTHDHFNGFNMYLMKLRSYTNHTPIRSHSA